MTDTKKTFEARIWEKSEHWYFDITVCAETEKTALVQLRREYPPFRYTVHSIRFLGDKR